MSNASLGLKSVVMLAQICSIWATMLPFIFDQFRTFAVSDVLFLVGLFVSGAYYGIRHIDQPSTNDEPGFLAMLLPGVVTVLALVRIVLIVVRYKHDRQRRRKLMEKASKFIQHLPKTECSKPYPPNDEPSNPTPASNRNDINLAKDEQYQCPIPTAVDDNQIKQWYLDWLVDHQPDKFASEKNRLFGTLEAFDLKGMEVSKSVWIAVIVLAILSLGLASIPIALPVSELSWSASIATSGLITFVVSCLIIATRRGCKL
jgi:hypothetical protein